MWQADIEYTLCTLHLGGHRQLVVYLPCAIHLMNFKFGAQDVHRLYFEERC